MNSQKTLTRGLIDNEGNISLKTFLSGRRKKRKRSEKKVVRLSVGR